MNAHIDLTADVNKVYLKLTEISGLSSTLNTLVYYSVTVQIEFYLDLKKCVSAVDCYLTVLYGVFCLWFVLHW